MHRVQNPNMKLVLCILIVESMTGEKKICQGKQMFFSEFLCPRHNIFQPEGYILLEFHALTYQKPLLFDRFCFILPLQIVVNHVGGEGSDDSYENVGT